MTVFQIDPRPIGPTRQIDDSLQNKTKTNTKTKTKI